MIVFDMPESKYHNHPSLSSTDARELIDSPAKYNYWKTRRSDRKSESMLIGSCAHSLILGVGSPVEQYPDEHLTPSGAISTRKETKQFQTEKDSAGVYLLTPNQFTLVSAMTESVLNHPEARSIMERMPGREVSYFQTIDGVPCKGRLDMVGSSGAVDIKTSKDASPEGFNRAIKTYGYHIQEAWYTDLLEYDNAGFKFVVVESRAPYLVGIYDLDHGWKSIGHQKARLARQLYLECGSSGVWPGYQSQTLTAPAYAYDVDRETTFE